MIRTTLAEILNGQGTEFFVSDNQSLVIHNRQVIEVKDAPMPVKFKLLDFIKSDRKREQAYIKMAGPNPNDLISQCVKCMFGNLDETPDLSDLSKPLNPEYVPCGKRGGGCEFEGIGCLSRIELPNGNTLSKGEMRYISVSDLDEKEIADKLCISVSTAKRHSQNIRIKTGIKSGKILALWAVTKGIIKNNNLWNY